MLLGDRKLGGILVERVETPTGPAAVVGIGINVAPDRRRAAGADATSLALEPGTTVDRTALLSPSRQELAAQLDALGRRCEADLRSGVPSSACATLGRDVEVALPGGEALTGGRVDVDERRPAGGPRRHGGTHVAVGAGDVVHVRPTGVT